MSDSYKIRLKNCAFFARHGVYREEEVLGQRFFVDAVLTIRPSKPLEVDEIGGTVDYGVAFEVIQSIITGERRHLIEALAKQIGAALSERFPQIIEAEITIRKPSAPVVGVLDYVEVTVVHRA